MYLRTTKTNESVYFNLNNKHFVRHFVYHRFCYCKSAKTFNDYKEMALWWRKPKHTPLIITVAFLFLFDQTKHLSPRSDALGNWNNKFLPNTDCKFHFPRIHQQCKYWQVLITTHACAFLYFLHKGSRQLTEMWWFTVSCVYIFKWTVCNGLEKETRSVCVCVRVFRCCLCCSSEKTKLCQKRCTTVNVFGCLRCWFLHWLLWKVVSAAFFICYITCIAVLTTDVFRLFPNKHVLFYKQLNGISLATKWIDFPLERSSRVRFVFPTDFPVNRKIVKDNLTHSGNVMSTTVPTNVFTAVTNQFFDWQC